MTNTSSDSNPAIELSIVIPCYNSEKSIDELVSRIVKTVNSMDLVFEIICINDNSKDATLSTLKKMTVSNLVLIDLMNNVGQFRALIAGMEHAKGNYLLTIDDDLQHAPEDIPLLYHKLKENPNLDVIIGATKQAQKSASRKVLSSLSDTFNGIALDKKKGIVMSSFRCMNKALVNAILNHQTIFPMMGPMVLKSTNRIENLEVEHYPRAYGKSNYGLIKLLQVSLNHVFNFSSLPLKMVSLLGVFLFCIGLCGLVCCYIQVALTNGSIFSSPVLFALLLWCTGLILLSIGIIGEYLYRILQEVNKTPRYAIREIVRR